MATNWSSFWGLTLGAYSIQNNRPAAERKIARLLHQRQMFSDQALLTALVGAAPGATAAKNYSEIVVPASQDQYGGKRTIAITAIPNRVTTSADVTRLGNIMIAPKFGPATYSADKSGNGGGGKAGF